MGLNGNVLGGKVVASDDDLVGVELGLGDGLGLKERIEIGSRSGGNAVEGIQLDEVVLLLGVSGSRGLSGELGQPTVEGGLSSLESRSGGSSGAGLLSTHSESAGGSLSGGDTASLSGSGLAGSGGGSEVIEGELEVFDVVDVRLVGLAALPVVELHGEATGGCGDRGKGSRSGDERGEGICWLVCICFRLRCVRLLVEFEYESIVWNKKQEAERQYNICEKDTKIDRCTDLK